MAIGDDTAPKWYPWHWFEFDKATRGWPLIARAVYRELLDFQWADGGSVPADPERLRMLVGASETDWPMAAKLVLPLFPKAGDRRINPKLELVRRQQAERMRVYSESGRAGGLARAANIRNNNDLPSDAEAMLKRNVADRDSDSDSERDKDSDKPTTALISNNTGTTTVDGEHVRVWTLIKSIYPKGSRCRWIHAEHAALNLVSRQRATWQRLLDGVMRYKPRCESTGMTPMDPYKFFSDGDDPWSQPWDLPTRAGTSRKKTYDEIQEQRKLRRHDYESANESKG